MWKGKKIKGNFGFTIRIGTLWISWNSSNFCCRVITMRERKIEDNAECRRYRSQKAIHHWMGTQYTYSGTGIAELATKTTNWNAKPTSKDYLSSHMFRSDTTYRVQLSNANFKHVSDMLWIPDCDVNLQDRSLTRVDEKYGMAKLQP